MNAKSEQLYRGITRIDDDLLEEAEADRQAPLAKKRHSLRPLALAACLLLVVGTVLTVSRMGLSHRNPPAGGTSGGGNGPAASRPYLTEDGVVIPPLQASLSADSAEAANMIPFFIYEGHWYVWAEALPVGADLAEERLGTATGLIDEWTPADGYVDLAGSVEGPFYRVKGIDPSFMLCMRDPSGWLELYVNGHGITLKTGADLVTGRLHLPERYAGLEYQSWEDWYYSTGTMFTLKEEREEDALAFLELLRSGTFVPYTGVEDLTSLPHIRVLLDNGLRAHFSLFANDTDGYVFYYGFDGVYLKVERETLMNFVSLLEQEDSGIPAETEDSSLTLEDCRSDPTLGGYLPAFLPESLAFQSGYIYYNVDPETAEVGPAERIHLELCHASEASGSYGAIDVVSTEELKESDAGVPVLEREELSLRQVEKYLEDGDLDVAVRMGDVAVLLSSRGAEAEDCFAILDSLPRS